MKFGEIRADGWMKLHDEDGWVKQTMQGAGWSRVEEPPAAPPAGACRVVRVGPVVSEACPALLCSGWGAHSHGRVCHEDAPHCVLYG